MGADEWDAGLERGCWRREEKKRIKEGGPQRARKEGREEECKGEGESRSGLLSVSADLRPSTEDKKRCCESLEPWCFFLAASEEEGGNCSCRSNADVAREQVLRQENCLLWSMLDRVNH